MSSLKDIQKKIRSALKKQNNYTKEMETAISLAAGSYMAFELALKDIEDLDKSYVTEISREGNEKIVPHPAFKVLKEASESTRKALRELRLTLATLDGPSDDDEIETLTDEVESMSK